MLRLKRYSEILRGTEQLVYHERGILLLVRVAAVLRGSSGSRFYSSSGIYGLSIYCNIVGGLYKGSTAEGAGGIILDIRMPELESRTLDVGGLGHGVYRSHATGKVPGPLGP
jgi:hypothetical protein